MRARSFFHVCVGLLLLALTCQLGAGWAIARVPVTRARVVVDSLNVVVETVGDTRIELRDSRGGIAVMEGSGGHSSIRRCTVTADPDILSGDCGGAKGRGSTAQVAKPAFGVWTLSLRRDPRGKSCPIWTRVRIDAGRPPQKPAWSAGMRLVPGDSVGLTIRLSRQAMRVEPDTAMVRRAARWSTRPAPAGGRPTRGAARRAGASS